MIDYIMHYGTEAQAKVDRARLSEAAGIPVTDTWRLNQSVPNIKLWQPSKDVVVNGAVVHTYLRGFHVLLALNHLEPLVLDAPALYFALDREAANRGEPFVIRYNISTPIDDVAFGPSFAGSNYPIGGYTISANQGRA